MLHWTNHNTSTQIRQALIYDYVKTAESTPDADMGGHAAPRLPHSHGMWDDWSDECRALAPEFQATAVVASTTAARL